MRNLASRASGIAAVVALGLIVSATPASAESRVGEIEVSDDGVTFAGSYPGAIFDDISHLTPGDSQSETIYVRNTGPVAGYLRVTLRDVRYSDQHFGNALTVTTSSPSKAGSATAISSANPCQVTNEGTIVDPGEIVPIVATLALGNLNGTDGQGATATLALRFALTESNSGTLPPTNCGSTGATVPVSPTNPGAPGTAGSTGPTGSTGSTGSTSFISGTVFAPVPNPGSYPVPTSAAATGQGNGTALPPVFASAFSLDPNTWRLYQEYLVLILFLATIIGASISWIVGRRSRKDAADA